MLRTYLNIKKFMRFTAQSQDLLLGRWNKKNAVITSQLSNYDHCGDTICRNPSEIKIMINRELSDIPNKKSESLVTKKE